MGQDQLWVPPGARGVFGGQIWGGAAVAAHRSLESTSNMSVHSAHAYFLLPGNPRAPIIYHVDRVRDGRSFATRTVKAMQGGKAIFSATLSFQVEEASIEHQIAMPDVPPPESLPSATDTVARLLERQDESISPEHRKVLEMAAAQPFPLDLRFVDSANVLAPEPGPPSQMAWIRAPDLAADAVDPWVHRCVVAFASDWQLCTTALRPAGLSLLSPELSVLTSLDHSMYFHRPFHADQWMLYAMHSPAASGARGLNVGHLFTQDGSLAVTVVQEALVRLDRT